MYSLTFSYARFCHCFLHPHFSEVPPPTNYYHAIKHPTHHHKNKSSVAVERRRRDASYSVIRSGLQYLFDLGEEDGDGPIELLEEFNPFQVPEATPLQTAASVVLTASIAFLLYRSIKRRAKRAKEKRFRSSGVESVKKEAKSEALEALEQLNSAAKEVKPTRPPPSALQALVGSIIAGSIAFVLYNLTLSVQSSLDSQAMSTNYSIRQITITIRTIVSGICYLATCVFAVNSIGLTLYSGRLALKFWMDIITRKSDSKPVKTENKMKVEAKDDNQ